MTRRRRIGFKAALAASAIALVALGALPAAAQGLQTGEVTGTVRDAGGLVLPGATVTVTSPALQGERTAVADENGVFLVRGLPPGAYTVLVELSGLQTFRSTTQVDLGRTTRVDATLGVATVEETVTVTAERPSIVTSTTGGANYREEEIDKLAQPRTVQGIATLAPGLTTNTPNAGQVTISGAFAFDNVFLIDGVDANDNLFGTSNNLFIEEAIEEVQVLTSGISAEYGRFSGGVVNAITKSGGNRFDGTFRVNLTNPSWREETPFEREREQTRPDELSQVYEATFGGPILRDRLWFFTAGRYEESTNPDPFPVTGIAVNRLTENKRFEGKVTGTFAQGHTLQGAYTSNSTDQTQPTFGFSIDPRTIVSRTLPNNLGVVNYRGTLGPRLFATAQVSRKQFGFRNSGGTSTNVFDSPFLTRGVAPGIVFSHYNAPYFDSTDPEDRNNTQVAASLSYFLTTGRFGSHDIKGGVENFVSSRTGGNSQTATDFVFQADYLTADGSPVFDDQGRLIPTFVPGVSRVQNWRATRGAEIDIRTTSFYVHDRWTLNQSWTFDLGARFENVGSEASGDITTVDTSTLVPRLGATYDATGSGRLVFQSTYAHYAGKYSEAQFAENTSVGNPTLILYSYTGPAGQGVDFAPGFDIANYRIIGGNFPTANVFVDDTLSSPTTREFTTSVGSQISDRAYAKATYTWRKLTNFVEDFTTTAEGQTTVTFEGRNFGTFDNVVFRNSDEPVRDYQAMQFQGRLQLLRGWFVNGNYTMQIENHGNFEGEGTNTPGISSAIGDYPEILVAERNFPTGRLNDFQRHKVRLWTVYSLGLGRFGDVDLSGIYRYDSPTTFSFTAGGVPLSAAQLGRNPGYARLPGGGSQTLFFGERGAGEFEATNQVDFAMNYDVPLFRDLRPWVKLELFNAFNDQPLTSFNTTVTADNTGARDANGLPTAFVRGPQFGRATSANSFPNARTFQMSFGVRF